MNIKLFRNLLLLFFFLNGSIFVDQCFAWRIVSADRIVSGSSVLTYGPGGIWCGFNAGADSTLRVYNPENGELNLEFRQPEERCYGLAGIDNNVWFLGHQEMILLEARGDIIRELDNPYESMRGLSASEDGLWTIVREDGVHHLVLFETGGDELHRFETTVQNPGDLSWDGELLWITDYVDGFIHVFNPENEREVDILPTPVAGPNGIAHNNGMLSLVDEGHNRDHDLLYLIDLEGEESPRILPISRYLDVGVIVIGNRITVSFAIFNIGQVDLEVESISLANGDNGFTLDRIPNNIIIEPNENYPVRITFEPGQYDNYFDTLIVRSNDPEEEEMTSTLRGLGIFNSRRVGYYPGTLNFGIVRADPWRDGSCTKSAAIFNMGDDPLVLDRIENGIDEIFHFDPLELPIEIETAETLWVDFWFTPHTGITYLDTLEIFTNEMRRRVELFLRGTGSDSVYGEGSVMWYHRLVEAEGEIGSIARIDDINEDGTDELVAVGPDGSIYCLNGFASDAADVLWVQDFGNQPYSPVNLKPSGVISGEGDLNEDGYRDIVIGSGAEDRSVYGISGIDGEQLWRWDSRSLDIEGGVQELINTDDMNGDGAFDPLVLINRDEEGSTSIVRLNGSTGRLVWVRNIEEATDIESLDDFDRDGAMDFIVSSANFIYLYGGSDGSLLARFEEPASAPVIAVSDLNQDNMDDLIYLTSEGNLTAKSIQDGEDIWSINSIGNFQLRLPLRFLINLENDVNGNDVNDIAGIDATGALFIVDPVLGDSILINQLADVTSFTVIPDINNDAKPELIIGHQNGRITCISSVDGSEIWIIEDQLIIERVVQIIPFEDVDLSGFNDIVGIFDDGIVRAISTGGELTIDKPELLTPSMHVISEISPNPFNGTVQISIDLPINSPLKLNIWDVNGRSIQVYNYGFLNSGNHKFSLNLAGERNLANGIYLFRFEGSFGHFTERVLFLK